jgi:NadR type nicotinamide-nucleotide adenylyltransferase
MKKIVTIGPESTGKSTLCEQLAQYYNTIWCPEFAREYLLSHGTKYNYDDLFTIAKGQLDLEDHLAKKLNNPQSTNHSLLFIDTDMYVMKVWCEFVFDKCHRFILEQIVERKYDLYLLCNIDLPWIPDELREYPDFETRLKLYKIYKDLMIEQAVLWVEISGNYDERLKIAISAVDSLMKE